MGTVFHLNPIGTGDIVSLIGTLVAGTAAILAYRAFRNQRSEFRQVSDRLERDEIKADAARVSCWIRVDNKTSFVVSNQAYNPIYNVVINFVKVGHAKNLETSGSYTISIDPKDIVYSISIPPGKWALPATDRWKKQHSKPGAEIYFTDSAGNHWHRNCHGQLRQLTISPSEFCGIDHASDVYQPAPYSENEN